MATRRILTALGVLIIISGCAIRKNLSTPLNIDIDQPAVANATQYCKPDSAGKYDGVAVPVQTGQNSSDGSAWAQGGGCILRPIRDTWATLNNLEVMKFKAADSFTATRQINPTPDLTHLYTITYSKSTIIGPISWTMDWYHGFDEGTFASPQRVTVNYQRVSGTSNIPIWSGGIVLTKLGASVTAIAILNTFKARQSSSANASSAQAALSELVDHARNGAPDWTRLDSGISDELLTQDSSL